MPLWNIYHPVEVYGADDKKAMSNAIVGLYSMLPKFYVGVVFHEVNAESFYIGGEPSGDFVRIFVDHIARQFPNDEVSQAWMDKAAKVLAPFTAERGLDWEVHVDETPFKLWRIQGLRPPLPSTEAEILWKTENRAVPYE